MRFLRQVANLPPIVNRPLVGQPILAAAGFQPALFVSRFVGFCPQETLPKGSSPARVNALSAGSTSYRKLPERRTNGAPVIGRPQDVDRLRSLRF
jgi:hypothetical protein